jgi:hypothetical protein
MKFKVNAAVLICCTTLTAITVEPSATLFENNQVKVIRALEKPIGMLVIFFAVGGRIIFRLRLSPPSRSEGQPILLGLHQEAKTAKP